MVINSLSYGQLNDLLSFIDLLLIGIYQAFMLKLVAILQI